MKLESVTSQRAMRALFFLVLVTGTVLARTDTVTGQFLRDYARFIISG